MNDTTTDAGSAGLRDLEHDERIQAMKRIACTVLQSIDLDELLSVITKELGSVLAFDRPSIALLSPNKDALILRNIHETSGAKSRTCGEGKHVPLESTNVMGWTALNREPVMRNDIESDARFDEIAGEGTLMSDMTVPLIVRGDCVGVFNIGCRRKNAFSPADLEIVSDFGRFACVAIEHVRLTHEARELGERCRLLLADTNDGIVLVHKKTGRIIEANEKSMSMLGYSREEMLGKSYIELFAREDLYQARKDFINILSEKAHSFDNRRMVGRENQILFVDINTSFITIKDDVFIQIVIYDVSRRKMLEQEIVSQNQRLHQVNRKLRDVDRMKTEFLANISHELRTPLSIILAYSEAIRDESISPDDRKQFLDIISENGETLLNLINNLLDLSKLEISGAMLNVTLSHVHDVIRSVWPQMEAAANAKCISISFNPGDSIPVMYLDTVQIKKVISCLLHNAIKFTDGGGSVRVATSLQDEEIIIKVVDTGMGIPFEAIPHIFAMFHQVDGSSSRKCGGMGIGLALAKHIVALHKGRLWVESEFGKGSEFTVSLPLDTEEALLTSDACKVLEGIPAC